MADREYPSLPRLGAGALVMKDESVLLVRRGRPPGQGLWALPGGMVMLGETLQQTVEREIKEETGITIEAGDPFYVFDYIERDREDCVLYHYVIVDLWGQYKSGEPHGTDDATDARWFARENLPEMDISQPTLKLLGLVGFTEA